MLSVIKASSLRSSSTSTSLSTNLKLGNLKSLQLGLRGVCVADLRVSPDALPDSCQDLSDILGGFLGHVLDLEALALPRSDYWPESYLLDPILYFGLSL